MAEKFLDIILRAKNQAGGAFQQFGAQVKGLKNTIGEGSTFGQLLKIGVGAGAVAGLTMAANKAREMVTSFGEWRDQLKHGEISFGKFVDNIVFSIPLIGTFLEAIVDIRDEWTGLAQEQRDAARQWKSDVEDANEKHKEFAEYERRNIAANADLEKRIRDDDRAVYIAAIEDQYERERQLARDEAAEKNREANEHFRNLYIGEAELREATLSSERKMLSDIADIDKKAAEARAKDAKERMVAEIQERLALLAKVASALRAAAGVGLPGGVSVSARFSGAGGTYAASQSIAAQRAAAAIEVQQATLLREIRDLQRKQTLAPPILIGV